jgi:hypothetical protein
MGKASRKPGRPATGHDPVITMRLPAKIIERLDQWCVGTGMSRSEAIRIMIEWGLQRPAEKPNTLARFLSMP